MFFILTTGRSGSKSIADYLSSSPQLICLHEPEPVLIEEATQYIYGNYSHDKMVELLRSTRPLRIDSREYGESNQKLSFVIPAILEAFPDSKFIWLVRDGRNVVNSTFSFGWYDLSIMPDSHWQSHLIQGPKVGDIDEYQWDKMDTFGKSDIKKAPNLTAKCLIYLARPEGFEPPTYRFVVCHSIQLSYGRTVM